MRKKILLLLMFEWILPTAVMADQVYCPQHAGYIKVGMSQDQVVAACGQPISKEKSDTPVTVKIPVQQLIYTTLNTGSVYPGLNAAFYDQWSTPSGTSGVTLQVDVVNDKVKEVSLNGGGTNATTLCQGGSLQVGDNVSKVYTACGSPASINSTFINQPIPSKHAPEIWIYEMGQYQPSMSLTFLNGQLQSIN